jgi:dienelactone hydrolase
MSKVTYIKAMRHFLIFFLFCLLGAPCAISQATQPTTPPKPHEIEITFQNGGITLAGTLLLPDSSGPVPAIVLTHGSGPTTREEGRPFAERFVRLGMAALIFDKRGCGASKGMWYDASLDDLADDAIAAAAFLTSRADVDSKKIGIWGVSQAGWVNLRAITRAPGVFAFAVFVTGGAVKPLDGERYDYGAALDRINATPEERREAMALVTGYFEYLRTGEGRDELKSAIKAAATKRWGTAADFSQVLPTVATRSKWEWVPTYDPEHDIVLLKIPVLVVLGNLDRPGLAEVAEERWRTFLAKAENPDATLLVFVPAGHGATTGTHHHYVDGPNTYAPGYFEMVDSWLRVHCALR